MAIESPILFEGTLVTIPEPKLRRDTYVERRVANQILALFLDLCKSSPANTTPVIIHAARESLIRTR